MKDKCDKCSSNRLIEFTAKCGDNCTTEFAGELYDDYPPVFVDRHDQPDEDIVDKYSDYIQPIICLDCGKVQGTFPKKDPIFRGESV